MDEELERLVAAGVIDRSGAEKISQLAPGTFCKHKSWGVGKVASWELLDDRILIDFEDKPGHGMKLKFAANALEVLPDDHILAQRLQDPQAVQALADDDPVELIYRVLSSHGNEIFLDDLEDILKGSVVSAAKYKTWWDATKKKLRSDRRFVVPSKRNIPLELRADDISPADAMIKDVTEAPDLKAKVKGVEGILADPDAFSNPQDELGLVVIDLNDHAKQNTKLFLGQAIELILARNDVQKAFDIPPVDDEIKLAELLRVERERLGETLRGLGVARQRQVLEEFPEAYGDEWVDVVFEILNSAGLRGISELTKFLVEQDKKKELTAFLRTGLQHRSLSSDLLTWICKERHDKAADLVDDDLPVVIMAILERDHFAEESRRTNRLADILQDDGELIPDMVRDREINAVRGFTRRLQMSPVFDDLTRKSLLARILKLHPQISELIEGGEAAAAEEDQEELIVSWESLEKRKADFDRLVNEEIPQNKKDIQIARSYGDLKENFEYKSAKEQETVLRRRREKMQQDLERAKPTDFANVDTSMVGIGTIVTVEDLLTSDTDTYTILGAWDSNPDEGVIPFTSMAAKSLIGKAVGEPAELPTEMEGQMRKVQVTEIRAYNS